MIVFVVLHYRVFEETQKCIESLLRLNGEKRIVVVDNCSPNNSGKKLKETYCNNKIVDIILNDKNVGFAKGNNIGYKWAKDNYDPDFIIVMNNDMEITDPYFITGIGRCYNEYKFNIMGPDVYSTTAMRHQNPDTKGEYDLRTLRRMKRSIEFKLRFKFLLWIKSHFVNKKKKVIEQKNDFVNEVREDVPLHGSFYVFDRVFIEKNQECFYDKTFMYMEAQILFHLARKNGMKMVYDPRIQVFHHEDVSTNSSYSNHYKKAIFTNECLLISSKAYIELLESEEV